MSTKVQKYDERGVRSLDLRGMEQREQRREEVKKQEEQQKAQQIDVDAAEAHRRGLRSYLAASYRQINVKRLQSDPALAFFVLANRDPFST
jgi:hypothetical protein